MKMTADKATIAMPTERQYEALKIVRDRSVYYDGSVWYVDGGGVLDGRVMRSLLRHGYITSGADKARVVIEDTGYGAMALGPR